MSTTTLYTQGKSTVEFDPAVPCMIGRFVGFHTIEEFMEFLNSGLDLMIEKKKALGKIAWIADTRLADVINEETAAWAAEVWNVRAIEADIRYTAFIVPEDDYALSTMSVEVYQERTEAKNDSKQMTTRLFKDEETAKSWLREVL